MRGSGPPQRVRLRFAPTAARYVREKVWHPSQSLSKRKDGGVVLTMKVTTLLEVKRWVLSFGAECEVLEPAQLRREIKHDADEMASRYV